MKKKYIIVLIIGALLLIFLGKLLMPTSSKVSKLSIDINKSNAKISKQCLTSIGLKDACILINNRGFVKYNFISGASIAITPETVNFPNPTRVDISKNGDRAIFFLGSIYDSSFFSEIISREDDGYFTTGSWWSVDFNSGKYEYIGNDSIISAHWDQNNNIYYVTTEGDYSKISTLGKNKASTIDVSLNITDVVSIKDGYLATTIKENKILLYKIQGSNIQKISAGLNSSLFSNSDGTKVVYTKGDLPEDADLASGDLHEYNLVTNKESLRRKKTTLNSVVWVSNDEYFFFSENQLVKIEPSKISESHLIDQVANFKDIIFVGGNLVLKDSNDTIYTAQVVGHSSLRLDPFIALNNLKNINTPILNYSQELNIMIVSDISSTEVVDTARISLEFKKNGYDSNLINYILESNNSNKEVD